MEKTPIVLVSEEPAMNGGPLKDTTKDESAAAAAAAKSANDVRIVTLSEYKEAALCLAEAFAYDDVARYFTHTPDSESWTEAERWDLHVSILEYITYAHILKGLVLTSGPNYGSVALWMPPGCNMDDLWTICRSGLWRLKYRLSSEGKARFFDEFLPLLHSTKHEVLGDRENDAWYLVYVGTRPSARGQGLAKKVIESVTQRADADSNTCYLESSNAINPIIYQRLGFEIERKILLTRSGKDVELDIMVREPDLAKRKSPGCFSHSLSPGNQAYLRQNRRRSIASGAWLTKESWLEWVEYSYPTRAAEAGACPPT